MSQSPQVDPPPTGGENYWEMEVICVPGLDRSGRAVHRRAVRAVIPDGGRLLMIHSPVNGDYKFPGGGVEPGESDEQALRRELLEECGARLGWISGPLGVVTEYDRAFDEGFELFVMTSVYYLCRLDTGLGAQRLDVYEADLGFTPVWLDMQQALQTNQALLQAGMGPRWVQREAAVLACLLEQFQSGV